MSASNDDKPDPPNNSPTPTPSIAPAPVPAAMLFALMLTVVVTLPVGLGVGVAWRNRSLAEIKLSTTSAHTDHTMPDRSVDDRTERQKRQEVEELFRAGDFVAALRIYQSKQSDGSLPLTTEQLQKLAACHEALGQWDAALEILRPLAEPPALETRAFALLAVGRIQLRRGDFEAARSTLGDLLRSDGASESTTTARHDCAANLLTLVELLDQQPLDHDPLGFASPLSPLDSSLWKSPDLLISDEAHRLTDYVRLARGERAFRQGDFARAAEEYRTLVTNTATPMSVIAAFNLGLVQFQTREFREASRSLSRFIDGRTHDSETSRALWFRGRSLLELGDGELAALDFKRAADLPGASELRAWSATLLGMAQLQANRPELAARDLFVRRELFDSGAARTEAGFVVSLARMEMLKSEESLDRESLFLLRSLYGLDQNAEWLGNCGRMLIGRAYERLGMVEQAIAAYEHALRTDIHDPFTSEVQLALADCLKQAGRDAEAHSRLTEVRQTKSLPWSKRAARRSAEWELAAGRTDECLAICRELLIGESNSAPILRLMGQAHEQAGQHDLAAECFAGVVSPSFLP